MKPTHAVGDRADRFRRLVGDHAQRVGDSVHRCGLRENVFRFRPQHAGKTHRRDTEWRVVGSAEEFGFDFRREVAP